LTNIKCVFWGVPVSAATATNAGQYRDSFEVVIAGKLPTQSVLKKLIKVTGSNGYNAITAPPTVPGWTSPLPWSGAPNCPSDPAGGYSTYIGSKFFSFGVGPGQIQYFSSSVCVATCSAQTTYNFAHPPADGKNPTVCNHVVAYVLNDNYGVAQGMYCTMYTESWDPSYGTVTQTAYQGGEWSIGSAYAYTNATYSATYDPICAGSSCAQGSYIGGNCGGWGAGTC